MKLRIKKFIGAFLIIGTAVALVSILGCETAPQIITGPLARGTEIYYTESIPSVPYMMAMAAASGERLTKESGVAVKPITDAQTYQESVKAVSKGAADAALALTLAFASVNPAYYAVLMIDRIAETIKGSQQNVTREFRYRTADSPEYLEVHIDHTANQDVTVDIKTKIGPEAALKAAGEKP